MAVRYCLDSNVVSDIMRGRTDVLKHLDDAVDAGGEIFISSIVYIEEFSKMKQLAGCVSVHGS